MILKLFIGKDLFERGPNTTNIYSLQPNVKQTSKQIFSLFSTVESIFRLAVKSVKSILYMQKYFSKHIHTHTHMTIHTWPYIHTHSHYDTRNTKRETMLPSTFVYLSTVHSAFFC